MLNDENESHKLNKIMNSTAHKQFNRLGTASNTISLSTSSPLIAKYMNLSTFSSSSNNSTNLNNDDKLSNTSIMSTSQNNSISSSNETSNSNIVINSPNDSTLSTFNKASALNPESYLSTKLNVSKILT
jgi:hypothetical protein